MFLRAFELFLVVISFASVAMADRLELDPAVAQKAQEVVKQSSQFTLAEKRSLLLGISQLQKPQRFGGVSAGVLVSLPGTPAAPVFCLKGRPTNTIEIEACAAAAVSIVGFTQALKMQFDLVHVRKDSGVGHSLSLGPGIGAKEVWVCVPLMGCGFAAGPEFFAALQYVAWLSDRLGVSVEIDFGANIKWTSSARMSSEIMVEPIVRMLAGFEF